MTPGQESFPESHEASDALDPVAAERQAIDSRDDEIMQEVYLCDREGTNFYVVAQGIEIPPESRELVLTDEVKKLLERVFAFNEIEQPDDLFSQEGGQITKDALRKYEDSLWEERRKLYDRLRELNPDTDDDVED